ncbi:fbl-1, partial [Pristionchus pacificus]
SDMGQLLIRFLLLLAALILASESAELSRCCSGGARHFSQTQTCSGIKSEGTTLACSRSASICCLRALLDDACDQGTIAAKSEQSCPANINSLGGGLRKECCDCCLLAKELVRRNEPCHPPNGFASSCLRSFNKCCATSIEIEGDDNLPSASNIHKASRTSSDSSIFHGDRCSSSKCEHLCNDRGGETVECSCRNGFDLSADGYSCVDVDECLLLMDDCLASQRCLNTPGSYKCIRTLSCGTGYALDSETEECSDVDECNLGTHDCGALYQCRNTQGSYRCDPKKCNEGQLQNPVTGECTSIECPLGYEPRDGKCNDINECLTTNRCGAGEECLNTPGGYRCQVAGSLCSVGYQYNQDSGFCDDIDECSLPNACEGLACTNLPGSFKCRCKQGFEFSERTKRCEDVDECTKFHGHVCDALASCHNTVGSFVCVCKAGFQLADDGRSCVDVDECRTGIARCDQKCINIPGSYQCICERGFALSSDGLRCQDIDECSAWTGSGTDLCMGGCINTPGSYKCLCPPGYTIQADGRTCQDIDECDRGECSGHDKICVNTLGEFKCHHISCPMHYNHDKNYKNNVEDGYSCIKQCPRGELSCVSNHTKEILYQFRAIPSMQTLVTPIEVSRIKAQVGAPFTVEYVMDAANRAHFKIEQENFTGIVKIIAPMKGPKIEIVKVHIHIKSRASVLLYHNVALIEVDISKNSF